MTATVRVFTPVCALTIVFVRLFGTPSASPRGETFIMRKTGLYVLLVVLLLATMAIVAPFAGA
ncbi:MAG: hypothetical protein WAV70_17645, partial [Anaerolineae bacterium]